MSFGKTPQLVLQTETPSGHYDCEGFSGITAIHPCYIVLTTDGTATSYKDAGNLQVLLEQEIRNLDPGVTSGHAPCGGEIAHPNGCHVHPNSDCRKLLVLIGTGRSPFPADPDFDDWPGRGDSYLVLPVVPESEKGVFTANLRPAFLASNAVFYRHDLAETVPAILAAVGLTAEEHRIFISYRRQDTQDLAEQLFDALVHEGFDVFLDRFRVPPALDFQRRLTQELADKSMVLVLESSSFANSEWTRYEIEFAAKHRLGLFALQVPGGMDMAGIDDASRDRLDASHFQSTNPFLLNQPSLEQTIARIKIEHGRKMVWRRRMLQQSMAQALSNEGLPRQRPGAAGTLHVEVPGSVAGTVKEYTICLTPRPPDLRDFHDTYREAHAGVLSRGLIVGPIGSQELARHQRVDWLGSVSGVACFDESEMADVAKGIKEGAL